jgi:hemophore-related protein
MLVTVRLAVVGALSAGAVAGALSVAAPAALADPAPNCSAADRAGITAGVQAATSAYLFAHPDVNDFMTSLTGQPVDQVPTMVKDYLDANPQTKAEIQSIRQPLADMRDRCGAPLLNQPYGSPPN